MALLKNTNLLKLMTQKIQMIPMKEKQMLESVRKAIIDIEFMESMGYPTEPTYELCINCPIKSCPSRDIIERL